MPDFPSTATLIGMVQSFQLDDANLAAKWFPTKQSLNNFYEFDLVDWSRGIAGYRHADGVAGTQATRTRTRKTVQLPTLREKKMLKESTLRWMDAPGKKAPGRAMEAIAEELQDLDGIIERTHEYVRWRLLCTGAITLIGEVTDTYTFGIGSSASAGVPWTTIATSDPLGNIVLWKETVRKACGVNPTEIILSTTAIKLIFESTKAQLLLGETTKDEFARSGVVKTLADMQVIVQDGGYRDSANAYKYFLSDDGAEGNMCIIKAPGAVGVTAEGPPVDSEAPDGMVGKFAKSFVLPDPSGRWILEAHTALPGLTLHNNFGAFTLW